MPVPQRDMDMPIQRSREFDHATKLGWWYGAYGFPRDHGV
jgi:hypothetical protein